MMTSTNLEKYVYSKKCLKQRRQPPNPFLQKVEGILPTKKTPTAVICTQLNLPIQQVE